MNGNVVSVAGELLASDLGVVLPHEHLMLDQRCNQTPQASPRLMARNTEPVSIALLGLIRRDPMVFEDNLVLNDEELMIQEVAHFAEVGGGTIVDCTPIGIGRSPEALRRIAEITGVNIVAATGFYVATAHPPWLSERSESEIADIFVQEIESGMDGTDIRAGIIGELGTTSKLHQEEIRVLRAAADAQLRTGVAVAVHMEPFTEVGLEALGILLGAGVSPDRIIAAHSDTRANTEFVEKVAALGVFVEFDTFGMEWYFDHVGARLASDAERVEMLVHLVASGNLDQVLLSQDVCTKSQLAAYGGYGLAHITHSIEHDLLAAGIASDAIATMRVHNPARALSRR